MKSGPAPFRKTGGGAVYGLSCVYAVFVLSIWMVYQEFLLLYKLFGDPYPMDLARYKHKYYSEMGEFKGLRLSMWCNCEELYRFAYLFYQF